MEYYHNLITQKSWQLLQKLRKKCRFVLIGGWAVYLYTKALKSKDIDLILDYEELEKLKNKYEVFKNERLKKYEARAEELQIDLYLPFYSELGFPIEEVSQFKTTLEGFSLPEPEVLVLLKAKAFKDRANSVKGRKDLIDIVSLLRLESLDFKKLVALSKKYSLADLLKLVSETLKKTSRIEELNLNTHQMARFKKSVLSKLTTNW